MEIEDFETLPDANYTFEFQEADVKVQSNKPPTIILYSVLLCVGLCGNAWMLWSAFKAKSLGSRGQFYLICLCISNVIVLCARCANYIGIEATGAWRGGHFGCQLVVSIMIFSPVISHSLLAGFNVDNMITVSTRHSYKVLRPLPLAVAIALSIILTTLTFLLYEEMLLSNGQAICAQMGNPVLVHMLEVGNFICVYGLPLLVILVFGIPAIVMLKCTKGNFKSRETNNDIDLDLQSIGQCIGLTTAFNILFIVCWTPFTVYSLVILIDYSVLHHSNLLVVFLSVSFLATAFSAILPIVYGVFNFFSKKRNSVSLAQD